MSIKIKINAGLKDLPSIDLAETHDLQGDLKDLNELNYDKLKKSLLETGLLAPLALWEDKKDHKLYIVDGHQRKRVWATEGFTPGKLPYFLIPGKNIQEAKKNLLQYSSQYGTITQEGYDVFTVDLDHDWLKQTLNYDNLWREFNPEFDDETGRRAKEDNYEIPDKITTDIKEGDLIEIGVHRLLCGDSEKKEDLDKLMNGKKADIVFTDPPYGVSIGEKNDMLNSFDKAGKNFDKLLGDGKNPNQLYDILLRAFINLKTVLEDCCTCFVTAPQGGDLGLMMMMMQESGLKVRHVLIWKKNVATFSLGRLDYDYKHEPILLTWNKKHKFYGKGQHKTSVWEIDKPLKNKEHPTMKPIALIENALLNNSKEGDILIDIFLGSGSSMIAAHQLGRFCYAMEIEPKYCQVTIERMLKHDPAVEVKINGKKYIS